MTPVVPLSVGGATQKAAPVVLLALAIALSTALPGPLVAAGQSAGDGAKAARQVSSLIRIELKPKAPSAVVGKDAEFELRLVDAAGHAIKAPKDLEDLDRRDVRRASEAVAHRHRQEELHLGELRARSRRIQVGRSRRSGGEALRAAGRRHLALPQAGQGRRAAEPAFEEVVVDAAEADAQCAGARSRAATRLRHHDGRSEVERRRAAAGRADRHAGLRPEAAVPGRRGGRCDRRGHPGHAVCGRLYRSTCRRPRARFSRIRSRFRRGSSWDGRRSSRTASARLSSPI